MTTVSKQFDTVIIGLGKTGASCARYLSRKGEASFAVVDSRERPPELKSIQTEYPELPVYLGSFNEAVLSKARRIIISPGVAMNEPEIRLCIDRGISITSDIELFSQEVCKPIIAVTGSNGKSTVVSLLTSMIVNSGKRASMGGNIGTPVLDLLELPEPDFYVLELSSFQLETVSALSAMAAAVLNVSEDHMDRYHDLQEYAAAKKAVYRDALTRIINLDDEIVSQMGSTDGNTIYYGLREPAADEFGIHRKSDGLKLAFGQKDLMDVAELAVRGDHNISNCLAALALGRAIGLPMDTMLESLKSFSGLPHRCQWVANIKGVDWFNDSKATNVGASCAAINGLGRSGKIILIAGGMGKEADFTRLKEIAKNNVRTAILMGQDANKIAKVLDNIVDVVFAAGMDAAVQTAFSSARAGDVVLLSPACASFDMYSDYQERGESFIEAVRKLERGNG